MIGRILLSGIIYTLGYLAGSEKVALKAGGKSKPAVVVNSDVVRELVDESAAALVDWAETDGSALIAEVDEFVSELLSDTPEV